MDELKPCPFCGGKARMVVLTSYPPKYQVEHSCKVVCAKPAETPEQAIAAWNTRAERTCTLTGNAFKAFNDTTWRHCSECDADIMEGKHNYCWKCGAKVVKA